MASNIVAYAEARFFNPLQPWVYAPNYIGRFDGSYTITDFTSNLGAITAPSIDCSHLVQEAMLAAGYNVPEITSATMAGIANGASSSYYSAIVPEVVQPGDVVVFQGSQGGHVGIVQTYDASTGQGTYLGAQSQNSGLLENVPFTTNGSGTDWGGPNETFIGFTRVNLQAYDPTDAARPCGRI